MSIYSKDLVPIEIQVVLTDYWPKLIELFHCINDNFANHRPIEGEDWYIVDSRDVMPSSKINTAEGTLYYKNQPIRFMITKKRFN